MTSCCWRLIQPATISSRSCHGCKMKVTVHPGGSPKEIRSMKGGPGPVNRLKAACQWFAKLYCAVEVSPYGVIESATGRLPRPTTPCTICPLTCTTWPASRASVVRQEIHVEGVGDVAGC